MNPADYAAEVAAEVRAEMGRQRKSQADLAAALDIDSRTAGRRLDASVPFDIRELFVIADWLDVPFSKLMPAHALSGMAS